LHDLSGTKSIDGKKHEDSAAAYIPGPIGIDTLYQTFNIAPWRSHGDGFVRIYAWPGNAVGKMLAAPTPVSRKTYK
jgi:hypothetical protein